MFYHIKFTNSRAVTSSCSFCSVISELIEFYIMYIQTIININAEKHSPDKLVLMLQ